MKFTMRLLVRRGIYYVEFSRFERKSLRTRNRAKAEKVFNRLKKDADAKRVASLEGRSLTRLGEFMADYLEYSQAHKSPNSYRADRLALGKILDHFGPQKYLSQVTGKEIEKFLGKLKGAGLKETSLGVYYRHLKAAFSKGKKWKLLRENPFADVPEPRPQKAPPRYLSPEEITRLLSAEKDPAFHRLWRFYLWSGVRRQEALGLTWADVDRRAGLIYLTKTKNRGARVVRILPEIARVLDELGGEVGRLWPWTPDAVSHHFQKTARRAGIRARLHDLRHTFASYLLMSGARLEHVKELMGHEDMKATLIYAHLDRSHLDAALERLKFGGT